MKIPVWEIGVQKMEVLDCVLYTDENQFWAAGEVLPEEKCQSTDTCEEDEKASEEETNTVPVGPYSAAGGEIVVTLPSYSAVVLVRRESKNS